MAFNILGTMKPETVVETIDIDLLRFSENNFFSMDNKRVQELADEIIDVGFKSVIEVRKTKDGMYEVICGETRARAIKQAYEKTSRSEFKYVPIMISDLDDAQSERRLIMDNMLARQITPAETMKAVERLKKYYQNAKASGVKIPGRIQSLIAQDLDLGKSQVGNYEKVLNNAIPEVRELIESGELTITAAAEISDLEDEEQLMFLEEGEELNLKTIKEYKQSLEDELDDEGFENHTEEVVIANEEMIWKNTTESEPVATKTIYELLDDVQIPIMELVGKLNCIEFKKEYELLQKIIMDLTELETLL